MECAAEQRLCGIFYTVGRAALPPPTRPDNLSKEIRRTILNYLVIAHQTVPPSRSAPPLNTEIADKTAPNSMHHHC